MSLYLVSGGAGFIGSHIAHALVARGDRVRVLDNLVTGTLTNLEPLDVGEPGVGSAVEFQQGSITDPDACRAAIEGVQGVFHEAAQVSVPASVADPLGSYDVNVRGTHNLLEAARAAGVQRFVFAASSAAYGESPELPKHEGMMPQPCSPYASGKVAAEHLLEVYARCFQMQTVSLRYFNVFGPHQADDSPYTGVIAIFARALLEGRAPTIHGDGEQTRDFTFVDNVVQANLSAMDTPPAGQGVIINVGGGERISLNQLHQAMAQGLGVEIEPQYGEARRGDVRHSLADLSRARDLLGYVPRVGWREGLQRTLEWYRQTLATNTGSEA